MADDPTEGRVFYLQEKDMDLVDIHCHILPMVDDGPGSVEEAIRVLMEMRKQGVRHAIVTPHFRKEMFEPSMRRVLYSYKKMKEIAGGMGITLRLGCEYYRDEQIVEDFNHKRRPTMAGSRYVLVEFSMNDLFSVVRNYIYELTAKGYRPVVAHVERYFCCQDLENVQELKNLGALIQVNAGSVLGEDGRKIQKFCQELMNRNLVDFIGSDTHNTTSRKLNLEKCASYVTKKMGKAYARRIFYENPLRIWKNR